MLEAPYIAGGVAGRCCWIKGYTIEDKRGNKERNKERNPRSVMERVKPPKRTQVRKNKDLARGKKRREITIWHDGGRREEGKIKHRLKEILLEKRGNSQCESARLGDGVE